MECLILELHVLWFMCIMAGVCLPSVDRFNEDSMKRVPTVERPNTTPSLQVNTGETSASAHPAQQQCWLPEDLALV